MERASNFLYTVLFCGMLAAVPVFWVLGIGVQTEEAFLKFDQRPRCEAAKFDWDRTRLREYFSLLERFVSDRLPFRDRLLGAKARVNLAFGKLLNPGVVVLGKEGWLFFGNSVGRGIDQYRGLLTLDGCGLSEIQNYFTEIQRTAAQAGIPLVIAIAPDKHSIYPEFLPDGLSRKGYSPADQIMAGPLGAQILDLRPVLLDAKATSPHPLYYKTDSHWNEFGAYLSYRAIMERLPGFAPVEPGVGDFLPLEVIGKGDLAVKVGGDLEFPDSLTHIRRNFFRGSLQVENLRNGTVSALPAIEMVRVSEFPSLKISSPRHSGTILLIGDSFLENISRFFNNSFGTVVYQSYGDFGEFGLSTLIERFRPQAVVFLMVERNLNLPVTRFIPAAGSCAIIAKNKSAPGGFVIPNSKLIAESSLVRGIEKVRLENDGVRFTALESDPYFHLPPVPPLPAGATVSIELTLPGERLVQLFYQTIEKPEFTEANSVTKILPAGRHLIQWPIEAPLNGSFRLDPGNGPGDYQIQKVEILPSDSSKTLGTAPAFAFANDKLLAESSLVRGIENIRLQDGALRFTSTGDDPYFHLPLVPPIPGGATVSIELTVPAERMVQLFYQTESAPQITEEQSVQASVTPGRHTLEWRLDRPLNGIFRLDPGNGPGEYEIHKIEIRP